MVDNNRGESTTWCEKCGDALETKPILRKLEKPIKGTLGQGVNTVIDHYEYYCFGCDITYKLVEIKNK